MVRVLLLTLTVTSNKSRHGFIGECVSLSVSRIKQILGSCYEKHRPIIP